MSALFGGAKVDKSAQTAQLAEQRRQSELVREQELEEGQEKGARNRILNARLQTRGVPTLVNATTPGGTTLAG